MINSPNTNVQLNFEQLQQIDETKNRLAVLESEIVNATKVLRGTKLECDRAIKEKSYYEELVANLISQTEILKTEYSNLSQLHNTTKSEHSVLVEELAEKKSKNIAKEMQLKDKEDFIVSKENDLHDEITKLNKNISIHENDKKDFKQKVEKLKEIISEF